MKATIELQKPDVTEAKTPITRLLDMLAGWSEYVQTEEDAIPDYQVSVQHLCDLYQDAGTMMETDEADQEEAAVREFVERRVLPVLLGESERT